MSDNPIGRRRFLKAAAGSAAAIPALPLLAQIAAAQQPLHSGAHSTARPAAPPQQAVTLNVRDFGATGDGTTKDTAALQEAIDRCAVLGGGEVRVPDGNYLTGSVQLRSDVRLRFEQGATLTGSPDEADYPITQVRWEGKWVQGHVGLIYAIGSERIAIAGPGKIAGYAPPNVPPNGQIKLRRPVLVELINCTDVRLEDFSTSYEGMWSIHPVYCENVAIRNLTIRSTGGLGDGIDVDSCRHVQIEGCDIQTGDDCISLKSGRGSEAFLLHRPTEDVQISNCTFDGLIFACIGIGSETSGGIRNVRIEHCKFTHARSHAIYIKTHVGRGAFIEDITGNDLDVAGTQGGFLRLNLTGSGKQDENPVVGLEGIPTVRNLRFSNVRVKDVPVLVQAMEVAAQKPVDGFALTNITGTSGKGIFLANMRNVEIVNVKVTGYAGSLVNIADVTGTGLHKAATVEAPKPVEPVAAPAELYRLG
jgi:polygalacturonase